MARVYSLQVRPLRSSELAFHIPGILFRRSENAYLGKSVNDDQLRVTILGALSDIDAQGRNTYDSDTIHSTLINNSLFEIYNETAKTTLDQMILQRQKAFLEKYKHNSQRLEAIRQLFPSGEKPLSSRTSGSKLWHIEQVRTDAQKRYNELEAAYKNYEYVTKIDDSSTRITRDGVVQEDFARTNNTNNYSENNKTVSTTNINPITLVTPQHITTVNNTNRQIFSDRDNSRDIFRQFTSVKGFNLLRQMLQILNKYTKKDIDTNIDFNLFIKNYDNKDKVNNYNFILTLQRSFDAGEYFYHNWKDEELNDYKELSLEKKIQVAMVLIIQQIVRFLRKNSTTNKPLTVTNVTRVAYSNMFFEGETTETYYNLEISKDITLKDHTEDLIRKELFDFVSQIKSELSAYNPSTQEFLTAGEVKSLQVDAEGNPIADGYESQQVTTSYPHNEGTKLEQETHSTLKEFLHPRLNNSILHGRLQIELMQQELKDLFYAFQVDDLGSIWDNELDELDQEVRKYQIALIRTFLLPPFKGVVTAVYKDVGESVEAGEPVLRIEDDEDLLLVGLINHRGSLRIGDKATIKTNDLFESGEELEFDNFEVVSIRGHDSDNDVWDVILQGKNPQDDSGRTILPINYQFDKDNVTVEFS